MAEAVRLVEAHRHAAMNQERWPDLQRWLSRLPRQVIDAHLGLVLAEAWLLHHRAALRRPARASGARRGAPAADAPGRGGAPEPAGRDRRSHRQSVYWTADAERTLTLARRALAVTPIEHSYVRALARLFEAGALQMRGDIRAAIETLDEGLREDRFGSPTYLPHLLVSFCFIYWVAADLPQLLKTAAHLLELARERNLPESLDWAHYFRGCAHYQRNDLEAAARDFAAVVSEPRPPTASPSSIARSGWRRLTRLRA